MNTTNMPGFTAEASLYQTSSHYNNVNDRDSIKLRSDEGIIPQLRSIPRIWCTYEGDICCWIDRDGLWHCESTILV